MDIDKDDTWASLALDLLGLWWESNERADTRGWGLLPETIQVHRMELPVGEHEITLSAARQGNVVGPGFSQRVAVVDGRNTYVLACFPDTQLVGRILTSGDGRAGNLTATAPTPDIR